MKRHGLRPLHLLLAGSLGLLLSGLAPASVPQKPRQEDFASYSLYIQALVDYQRALDAPPPEKPRESADASKLCQDGGSEKEKKKNSCEGKYLMVKDVLDDGAQQKPRSASVEPEPVRYESLEEAISRGTGETGQAGGEAAPRSTFNSFPLAEIPSQDLSESGVAGLLGLFDNVRMRNLGSNAAGGGIFGTGSSSGGGGSSSTGGSDSAATSSLQISLDNFILEFSSLDFNQLANTVSFGDGYSIVNATVNVSGSGLSIGLSSETYTPVYVVDRDGLPRTAWDGAGAFTVDHMAIIVPYVEANIQSVRTTGNDESLLQLDTYSPGPIYVNLGDTNIGVAPASRDGSWIGESTNFLTFGPESVLTVNAGTRVRAVINKPDGLNSAFVTLNGRIGDLSLSDITLKDVEAGGEIRVGKFAMQGLELIDTKIFMNERSVVIDTGRSFSDVGFDVERLYLGTESAGAFVGDFYARGGNLENLRFTATPH